MRADPRFRTFAERMGMGGYWRTRKTGPDAIFQLG
jgi:hypothetical protein